MHDIIPLSAFLRWKTKRESGPSGTVIFASQDLKKWNKKKTEVMK